MAKCLLLYRPAHGGVPSPGDAELLVAALGRVCAAAGGRGPERQLEARCSRLAQAPVRGGAGSVRAAGPRAAAAAPLRRMRLLCSKHTCAATAKQHGIRPHTRHLTHRRVTCPLCRRRAPWQTCGWCSCRGRRRSACSYATCERGKSRIAGVHAVSCLLEAACMQLPREAPERVFLATCKLGCT